MMKKKLISLIPALIIMVTMSVICAFAADPRVIDDADFLTNSQEEELTKSLDALSEKLGWDVVVMTKPDLGGFNDVGDYAYNIYRSGNYSKNGVFMLVTDGRPGHTDVHVGACGAAADKITDKRCDKIIDSTLSQLKNQNYTGAFNTFSASLEKQAKASKFAPPIYLLVSPLVGILVGFIYAHSLKAQLNSVKMAANANDYLRQGSFRLTGQRDTFLYHDIKRTHIQRSSGSGSSGSHRSGSSRHI